MYRVFLPYKISQIEHFQKPTLSSHTEAFHIASQGVTVIIDVALFACLTPLQYAWIAFCITKLCRTFRYFNEMSAQGLRARTVSSPIPYTPSPSSSRPISPGR